MNNTRYSLKAFFVAFLRTPAILRDIFISCLAISVFGLAMPLLTQTIVDEIVVNKATHTLVSLAGGIAFIGVLSSGLSWASQSLLMRLSRSIDVQMAQEVWTHMLKLPLSYFSTKSTGSVTNRIYNVERLREFVASTLLLCAIDVPFMVIFLALMLHYSVLLTEMVLSFQLATIGLSLFLGPRAKARGEEAQRATNALAGFTNERLAALETLKSLRLENAIGQEFTKNNSVRQEAIVRMREFGFAMNAVLGSMDQVGNAIVMATGAYLAITSTALSIGMLVAFQMFSQRVTQALGRIAGLTQSYQQAKATITLLAEVVDAPTESYVGENTLPATFSSLRVQGLKFTPALGRKSLFNGLSFEVLPGTTTLLTGRSGAGKSTLIRVLLGMHPEHDGQVLLDGVDCKTLGVGELRQAFGVVPQESVFFSGSILENFRLGCPSATLQDVQRACQQAGLHDSIEQLPAKYDTQLGQRGTGLSGGQRQRLSVARALLGGPQILLFDEPVASLDKDAARHIAETVNALRGEKTIIFVSHIVPENLIVDQHIQLG